MRIISDALIEILLAAVRENTLELRAHAADLGWLADATQPVPERLDRCFTDSERTSVFESEHIRARIRFTSDENQSFLVVGAVEATSKMLDGALFLTLDMGPLLAVQSRSREQADGSVYLTTEMNVYLFDRDALVGQRAGQHGLGYPLRSFALERLDADGQWRSASISVTLPKATSTNVCPT